MLFEAISCRSSRHVFEGCASRMSCFGIRFARLALHAVCSAQARFFDGAELLGACRDGGVFEQANLLGQPEVFEQVRCATL